MTLAMTQLVGVGHYQEISIEIFRFAFRLHLGLAKMKFKLTIMVKRYFFKLNAITFWALFLAFCEIAQ